MLLGLKIQVRGPPCIRRLEWGPEPQVVWGSLLYNQPVPRLVVNLQNQMANNKFLIDVFKVQLYLRLKLLI